MKDILKNALLLKIQPNCGIASYTQGLPARGPSRELYPRVSKGQWHSFSGSARAAEMHSSCSPDQLCGSSSTVGQEGEDWHQSDRDKFSLRVTWNKKSWEPSFLLFFFSPQSPVLQKKQCCAQGQREPSAEPLLFPSTLETASCFMYSQWAAGCCCASQMDTGISKAH